MKRTLYTFFLLIIATLVGCNNEPEPIITGSLTDIFCNDNEIYYTSSNGQPISPKVTEGFGGNITNNSYQNGVGCITFDGKVTALPEKAFNECGTLLGIKLPYSVTTIGKCAFQNCYNLTKIELPNSVIEIGNSAFVGCTKLTSVDLGSGIQSIGSYAFAACTSLTTLTLPESLTYIGENAIPSHIKFEIPDSFCITYRTTSSELINIKVDGCGADFIIKHTLNNGEGRIVFNRTLSKVGGFYNDYENRELITEITIPECITEINDFAFQGCSRLATINFPTGLTNIGENAFNYCYALTSATIPDGVSKIEEHTFSGCKNLASVTIGNGVQTIGKYAFEGCESLASIVIPDSVTHIGDYAFPRNTSVALPANFYINYTATSKIDISAQTTGTDFVISDTFENGVGRVGFNSIVKKSGRYDNYLTGVTLPETVTIITPYAFSGCNQLTEITIPEAVTEIGSDAFNGCSSLATITIPKNVTKLGAGAFRGCSSLAEVYCHPTTPPTIGRDSNTFTNNAVGRTIYVPEGSVETYCTAEGWSTYKNFITSVGGTPTPKIGDIVSHNGAMGVCYYIDDTNVKLVSIDYNYEVWLRTYGRVNWVGTTAISASYGQKNCESLASSTCDDYNFPAYEWCVKLGEGWYLPAYKELQEVYAMKDVINTALSGSNYKIFQEYEAYWSSTDCGNPEQSYAVDMKNGEIKEFSKKSNIYVRAITVY